MPSSKGFRKPSKDRTGEPVALGDLLDGLLAQRPLQTGARVGRLVNDWGRVVGQRLADESAPAGLEGGTLTIAVRSSAWGTQLEFLADEVRRKVNTELGSQEVKRVRIVVAPDRLSGPHPTHPEAPPTHP